MGHGLESSQFFCRPRRTSPKLGEAQASQALDPVLRQIGKTDDYGALKALARALQALPIKLGEAQASQALVLVLKQIGKAGHP